MKRIKKKTIDSEVDHVVECLSGMDVDSDKYRSAVQNLEILCNARSCKTNRSISFETLIMAGTNLLGIIMILDYEQLHVVASKAVGLILKGRI